MFPFPFSFIASAADIPVERIANAKAMSFNGTDAYVDAGTSIGNLIGDNYTGSLSASLWFKRSSNTTEGLIAFTTTSWGEFNVIAYQDKIRFAINLGGYYIDYDSAAGYVYDTNWHHLAVVMTPNASVTDIKMYFDGQLLAITPGGSSPTPVNLDFAGLNLFIGAFDSTSYSFNGQIDEVAIFNKELSASKIQQIYDATAVVGGVPQTANLFTGGLSSSLVYWNRMGDS